MFRALVPDDPVLPAAGVLTGSGAHGVLAAAVEAAGGTYLDGSVEQVAYRPGSELVVRYAAQVAWNGAAPTSETLFAGMRADGAPHGTIPVTADADDRRLEVGVWRWPFDPALPGLEVAVDPVRLGRWRSNADSPLPIVSAISHRPCRRAVIRAAWRVSPEPRDDRDVGPAGRVDDGSHATDGTVEYVKAVAPGRAAVIAATHDRLIAGGVPVPAVRRMDDELGLLALAAADGDELRGRLLRCAGPLPGGYELVELVERIASVDPGPPPRAARRPALLDQSRRHAVMLSTVLPAAASLLDDLSTGLDIARARLAAPRRATVHGDLHEAQLRVDRCGRIVGVLDVDDAGTGDPLDDLARASAHLIGLATIHRSSGGLAVECDHLDRHAHRVITEIESVVPLLEFRLRLAAALVGLATVPFCMQTPTWQRDAAALVERARSAVGDVVGPRHHPRPCRAIGG